MTDAEEVGAPSLCSICFNECAPNGIATSMLAHFSSSFDGRYTVYIFIPSNHELLEANSMQESSIIDISIDTVIIDDIYPSSVYSTMP
jgi:hypothetical protein